MDKNNRWPWMAELDKRMEKAFFDACNEGEPKSVLASMDFADGSMIEVELCSDNQVLVYIYHANEQVERDLPNMREYIEDNLISWEELAEKYESAMPEDEWTAHGFRNEADYWHYRMSS